MTAPSLHVGSLTQIMLLRRLQQAGGKPIVLMGGGTTRVGDPSGRDETRASPHAKTDRRQHGLDPNGVREIPDASATAQTDAVMVDNSDWLLEPQLHRFPARCRPPLLGQPHAHHGSGQAPARTRAADELHRVQLHDPAGLRFRGAQQALRLPPANGRLRSMGQHRQRRRTRPPLGHRSNSSASPRR